MLPIWGLNLWPMLLPVAAASGWVFGRRSFRPNSADSSQTFTREYYVGLNYLLNEQPDKAVDVFIKLFEVDNETVETHLALGSLFRRRGEVDRAIRIHQNLIARPQLNRDQRIDALLALGRDYMSAGVLDRAERLFQEVSAIDGDNTISGLRYLLDIYQQEKSWHNAIKTVKRLEAATGESSHKIIAHHYCELTELALKNNDEKQAKYYLKLALQTDSDSVRASLLLAKIEMYQGRYQAAIKEYKKVKLQDPDFLSEVVQPLLESYQYIGREEECINYLRDVIKDYPRISILLVIAEYLRSIYGVDKAADFFAEQLQINPSIRGVNRLIQWYVDATDGKVKAKLQVLLAITHKLMQDRPNYRCSSCGFGAKKLLWHCPSCRQWNTVKPIHGLEGD